MPPTSFSAPRPDPKIKGKWYRKTVEKQDAQKSPHGGLQGHPGPPTVSIVALPVSFWPPFWGPRDTLKRVFLQLGDILIFSNTPMPKPCFHCSNRPSFESFPLHFSKVSSGPPPGRPFSCTGTCKVAPGGAQVPKQGSQGPPRATQNGTKIHTFGPGGNR